jgi:hypothetical protein
MPANPAVLLIIAIFRIVSVGVGAGTAGALIAFVATPLRAHAGRATATISAFLILTLAITGGAPPLLLATSWDRPMVLGQSGWRLVPSALELLVALLWGPYCFRRLLGSQRSRLESRR